MHANLKKISAFSSLQQPSAAFSNLNCCEKWTGNGSTTHTAFQPQKRTLLVINTVLQELVVFYKELKNESDNPSKKHFSGGWVGWWM
jgi:hypothetical protein